MTKLLFSLGIVAQTPGAADLGINFLPFLRIHASGDWGDVCEEDAHTNDRAVEHGHRVLSSYTAPNGEKFWIITEHDRSVTTILLPNEY
ncbi:MAG: hypothetical protein L3J16_06500 [Anaerolineales bacterium]|nr:hypothetical protein [Anaerolineales bacterium]